MSPIEISLLVIGVIFLLGSFFLQDRLSQKDMQKIADLSQDEIRMIMEKQLKNAKDRIEEQVQETVEESAEATKRALHKETTEKILAISEYSDTVLESMNKSHNEIMFLYSMLNDKHSQLTDLAGQLSDFSSDLKKTENDLLDRLADTASEIEHKVEAQKPVEQEKLIESSLDIEDEENHNVDILSLHKAGKNDVEIAKELGLGLGEVKLVIGLYKKEQNGEA